MADISREQARAAKAAALRAFSKLGEVVGVGITRVGSAYGLKVNLRSAPDASTVLPEQVDGVPVKVEIVGTIRPRT